MTIFLRRTLMATAPTEDEMLASVLAPDDNMDDDAMSQPQAAANEAVSTLPWVVVKDIFNPSPDEVVLYQHRSAQLLLDKVKSEDRYYLHAYVAGPAVSQSPQSPVVYVGIYTKAFPCGKFPMARVVVFTLKANTVPSAILAKELKYPLLTAEQTVWLGQVAGEAANALKKVEVLMQEELYQKYEAAGLKSAYSARNLGNQVPLANYTQPAYAQQAPQAWGTAPPAYAPAPQAFGQGQAYAPAPQAFGQAFGQSQARRTQNGSANFRPTKARF